MQSEVVLSNNCNKLELPISNLKQFHTLSKYLFPEIMKLVAEIHQVQTNNTGEKKASLFDIR